MRAIYSAQCYALLALKQARPATTSYLRDFVLGQNIMSYIPPMIGRGWDCRSLNKILKQNHDGVSWVDYYEDLYKKFNYRHEVTVLDENTVHVELLFRSSSKYSWSVHDSVKLTIYGRGDFNGDGLDDLLIKWDVVSRWRRGDPAASNSAVYIATRYKRDDVLRVVDFLGPPPTGIAGDCTYARKYIIESGRPE